MAEVSTSDGTTPSNSETLWQIVTTFTNEAQQAAKKKSVELGYSLDKGTIPFEETLINLSQDRDVLIRSIENKALTLLPLKIQAGLISDARKVSTQLQAMIGGGDAAVPFITAVDDLTASIWQSNIQNMTGEILGLHEKLDQLKTFERSLRELNNRAAAFHSTEKTVSSLQGTFDEAIKRADATVGSITSLLAQVQPQADSVKAAEQKSTASLAVTQQTEQSIANSLAAARTSAAEVESLKNRASADFAEVESLKSSISTLTSELTTFKQQFESEATTKSTQYAKDVTAALSSVEVERTRLVKEIEAKQAEFSNTLQDGLKVSTEGLTKQIQDLAEELKEAESSRDKAAADQLRTSKTAFESETARLVKLNKETLDGAAVNANKVILENQKKTADLIKELEELEGQIRDKIMLATNYQLFHAFQTRQLTIAQGVTFWRNALFATVGLSFLATIVLIGYLVWGHPTYDAAFFLKLGFTIPIAYAVHFCSTQYSRERQLEEEYAFKGNISISLEPYRELVEKLIKKDDAADAQKYTDFVLASIEKVFTSPTQQVLGAAVKPVSTADEITETSKGLTKILGSLNDIVQSVAKLKG